MSERFKKSVRTCFNFVVSALFIYFLFYNTDFHQIRSLLVRANLWWLLLGFFALVIGYAVRAYRWGLLLKIIAPRTPLYSAMRKFIYALALNNILPFRAGDFYRLVALQKSQQIDSATVLSTLVLERLLDLLILLGMFFVVLQVCSHVALPDYFVHCLKAAAVIGLLLALLLFLFPGVIRDFITKRRAKKGVSRSKLDAMISAQAMKFISAILYFRSAKTMAKLVGLTLVAWLFEGGLFVFSAFAVDFQGSVLAPFFASFTGALSTLLPSSPGYIGTFDYFTTQGFTSFGVVTEVAIAATLLIHLCLWLPVTVFGLCYQLISIRINHRNKVLNRES